MSRGLGERESLIFSRYLSPPCSLLLHLPNTNTNQIQKNRKLNLSGRPSPLMTLLTLSHLVVQVEVGFSENIWDSMRRIFGNIWEEYLGFQEKNDIWCGSNFTNYCQMSMYAGRSLPQMSSFIILWIGLPGCVYV